MPGYSGGSSGGGLSAPVALSNLAAQAEATLVGVPVGGGTVPPSALTLAQQLTLINAARLVGSDAAAIDQTSLTIGSLSLTTGRRYTWAGVLANKAGAGRNFSLNINGDVTAVNYITGWVSSSGGGADNQVFLPTASMVDASSQMAFIIEILVTGTTNHLLCQFWFGNAGDWYMYSSALRYTAAITALNGLCSTADQMASGSWMRLEAMA